MGTLQGKLKYNDVMKVTVQENEQEKDAVVQRYVNILSNAGFKALFGDRKNKEVVISILNALLPEHRQVMDIDYLPTEHQGQTEDSKEYRYDFMCTDRNGVSFIVETQRYHEENWFRRCVSYASRMYDMKNHVGGDYSAPPVYLIGLMGVSIDHPDMSLWENRYISEYTFREKMTHDLLDETIIIIFAELARFSKTLEECTSDLDRMLYVLKNSGDLKKQSSWLRSKIYAQILQACEIAKFSEEKRIQYNKDMKDERRREGELQAAKRIGREEGRVEGRVEGRAEGRAEGSRQKSIEIAHKLMSKGHSVQEISDLTGLTVEEIMKL